MSSIAIAINITCYQAIAQLPCFKASTAVSLT